MFWVLLETSLFGMLICVVILEGLTTQTEFLPKIDSKLFIGY